MYLKQWNIEDAYDMARILNDEEIHKMLDTPYPYTIEMAISFINNICNRTNNYYEWKMVLKENNKIIGGTALNMDSNPINLTHIYIDKDYRKMGYAKEVWNAKIKYAFQNSDTRELICAFYKENIDSRKMQENTGMTVVGEINNQLITKITRDEFISKVKR